MQRLHLSTLKYRWLRGYMIELHKMVHKMYDKSAVLEQKFPKTLIA
jgi:hypothetical protein